MLEHRELQAFTALAQFLNFARAAEELRTSSPNLSKIIAQLESKLKRKLFLRTTRAVRLSADGESFLPHAVLALDSMKSAGDLFQKKNPIQLEGGIRLTAPQTLAQRVLNSKLTDFHIAYPQVNFDLIMSDQYLDLIEENIDVAFRVMSLHNSSLKLIKIAENPIIVCASPDYLKKHKSPTSPDQLRFHSVLAIRTHTNLRFQKAKKKLSQLATQSWLTSTNGDLLVEQALRGQGLLVRSRWGVQRELDSGKLHEINLKDSLESNTAIYMVFPENSFMSQRVRTFIDFMKKAFIGSQ